jgi:hypothetical protein
LGVGTLSLGCSDCEDPYPVGTRLRVTVPEAFAGCHVTFDAGATYDLVAGGKFEDEEGCEYNVGKAPPVFTSTDFSLSDCRGAKNMGASCRAPLPGCADTELNYSHASIFYGPLPKEPGDIVSSLLKLQFKSASECRQSCNADIPVTIRW